MIPKRSYLHIIIDAIASIRSSCAPPQPCRAKPPSIPVLPVDNDSDIYGCKFQKLILPQSLRAFQALLLVSLALSESSMVLLIQRVFTTDFKGSKFVITGMHILNGLWSASSIVAISANCSPEYIFENSSDSTCPGDDQRWQAIYSISVGLAIAVAIFPVIFIAFLKSMPLKHKMIAAFAFLCRLPLIPLAIVFIITYTPWSNRMTDDGNNSDPSLRSGPGLVLPLIFQQCHLAWSLMSASIPSMRSFIRTFSKAGATGYEHTWADRHNWGSSPSDVKLESQSPPTSQYQSQTTHSGTHSSRPSSISRVHSVSSSKKAPSTPVNVCIMNDPSPEGMKLRPEKLESKTMIYHSESPPQSKSSSPERLRTGSTNSREKFIKRETHWEVCHSSYTG
jgi:hypothetical protein